MKRTIGTISAILITGLASSTVAAGEIHDLTLNDLIGACEQAISTGVDPLPYANELLARSKFHLGERNRERGTQCLNTVYQKKFKFEGGKFTSFEDEALKHALAQARIELAQRRRRAFASALVDACHEKYSEDRFEALTANACAEIFIEHGLP